MRVAFKTSNSKYVKGPTTLRQRISIFLENRCVEKIFSNKWTNDKRFRSLGLVSGGLVKELNNSDTDIIQLNWICGLLSIKEISKIKKPLVWRFSDMWPFCGSEHYANEDEDAPWINGYDSIKYNCCISKLIDKFIWKQKQKAWKQPIQIVTPSQWLADCVKKSFLMQRWPITVIPSAINTNVFRPLSKIFARKVFGLPLNKKLILFNSLGGGIEKRKGFDMFSNILQNICSKKSNTTALICGSSENATQSEIRFPAIFVGHLTDETSLALIYNAADFIIIPSRQDNLPQTGIEAQSCGCPVLSFNKPGLQELVDHKSTGFLADDSDLKNCIEGVKFILQKENAKKLSFQARQKALRTWSQEIVVKKYLDLYKNVIKQKN